MAYEFQDMVQVRLPDPESFLKIKETLTRMGVASKKEKILYQTCHILHKSGKYAIPMFKELFSLDGKPTNFTENDIARRNTIVNLLAEWKLVELVDPAKSAEPVVPVSEIKILSYKDKGDWQLIPKYSIGKRRED